MIGIDAHCHVFADPDVATTPLVDGAAYEPPQVDVGDHSDHLREAGCDRGVLVQPSAYGADHRCLLAALEKRPDALRGVACVRPGTPARDLERLHEAGVRGTRVQDGFAGGVPVEALGEVAEMVAPLGWHIEVWTDVRRHVDWLGDSIRCAPAPVVLDHMGFLPSGVGVDDPAMRLILDLLSEDQVWVTLSGLERLLPSDGSSPGSPEFDAVWQRHEDAIAERVQAFAEARAENLLWGSDWPHVGLPLARPASSETRDRLHRWLPDEKTQEQVLVHNPRRRYAFS